MTIQEWIESARTACLQDTEAFLRGRGLLPGQATLADLKQQWAGHISAHFDPKDPGAFYGAWDGDVGASNIPTNIEDQFSRDYIVAALVSVFAAPFDFAGTILDFGCGTAAISLSWKRSFATRSRLLLADVDNLPRDFVRYQIEAHGFSFWTREAPWKTSTLILMTHGARATATTRKPRLI